MKKPIIMLVISILAIYLTPTVSASLYYNTDDIQKKVIDEAIRQNVDPSLALAIAKVESNFNPQALSHAGAKGVMQIMPRTAEQVFGVDRKRLFDPEVNITIGIKFIKKLLNRYNNRLDIALSHYNGGSGVKNRYGKLSVMPSTRKYVDKVLATQQKILQHGPLQHRFLQQDRPLLLASRFEGSGVSYTEINTDQSASDLHITASPKIETLRALRVHNITRNYKDKKALSLTSQPALIETPESVQTDIKKRIEKVRMWESIYQN